VTSLEISPWAKAEFGNEDELIRTAVKRPTLKLTTDFSNESTPGKNNGT
jgi:hypothetical protein